MIFIFISNLFLTKNKRVNKEKLFCYGAYKNTDKKVALTEIKLILKLCDFRYMDYFSLIMRKVSSSLPVPTPSTETPGNSVTTQLFACGHCINSFMTEVPII